jgi:hypothetical protein
MPKKLFAIPQMKPSFAHWERIYASIAMLLIIAFSPVTLIVGPSGSHVPSFSQRLNCADSRTFHKIAGRDPTCLLAPGFSSENYGGAERVSDKAARAGPMDTAFAAGYLDRHAMGTGCAEHHGCYIDYSDDEEESEAMGGVVVQKEDMADRKAAIKAKREQAAQLLAEADALEEPRATHMAVEELQPAYAWE